MLPGSTDLLRWVKNSQIPVWAWSLAGLALLALAVWLSADASPQPSVLTPNSLTPNSHLPNTSSLFINITLKLSIVLLLVYASLSLLRRLQSSGKGVNAKKIHLLETTHLSPRQKLHLVRIGSQVLLVGATDQTLSLISEIEPQAVVEGSPDSLPQSTPATDGFHFTGLLRQAVSRQ